MTMRTARQVEELLARLESEPADRLEDQDLDFKQWHGDGYEKAIRTAVEWAICMANGGGGTVVFGVADNVTGREAAIQGVPLEIEVHRLKQAVYDRTDPKLTPTFEELRVPEGTGRLLIMEVHPGLPPYTDTKGRGTVRVGKECKPLTGTLRRKIGVETGESDFTAEPITERPEHVLSASAMEKLRDAASREQAPAELLSLPDADLLSSLGVVQRGQLTRAGLLLAGEPSAINRHVPHYAWTYLRMKSAGEYTDRADGQDALPSAMQKILDRMLADNPIQTVRQGLFHFEYRTYPELALREILLNAFAHADYRVSSPILVKHYPGGIEVSNPGGFIGGVTPENILHHPPISRNPCLVGAMVRLRLVNRSNLGIQRVFHSLLIEGKEPPVIEDLGDGVRISIRASDLSVPFRTFVAEEEKRGVELSVDHLLVLQHLLRHAEIDTATAARICQRGETDAREILAEMERRLGYLERGGAGRGTFWTLRAEVHGRLAAPGDPDRDRRTDWEAAKTRVLSVLKQRAEHNEAGLSNKEIRQLTHLNRNQVFRLLRELREEQPAVRAEGRGAGARYRWAGENG